MKNYAVSCNQIAVLQAENGRIAKHRFQVQNKWEDIGIKEMLRKIYISDFLDTILNGKIASLEKCQKFQMKIEDF